MPAPGARRPSPTTAPRKPLPPRKRSRARAIAGFVALAFLGVAATAGGLFLSKVNKIGGKGGVASIIGAVRNPRGQFPNKDRVTVLLLGKDYNRYVSKTNKELNGQPYTKDSRSDSIILLSLDLKDKKVSALSIPRDTYIGNLRINSPYGRLTKINATYATGGEKLLRETIEKMLGVRPDYFVAIKPDAVKALVDELGGVEVETIDRMKYDDYWGQLHVDLPAGRQVINGTQAVGFARFREVNVTEYNPDGTPVLDRRGRPVPKRRIEHSKEEGDPRRMARQQQLIRAMAAKARSFDNLLKLDEVVQTGLDQIETDLSRQQIIALAALFRTSQPDQMQSGTLPGEGSKRGAWVFHLDERKSKAMVDWLIKGDERAANKVTVVAVQNGTVIAGAAARVMEKLREEGFDARNLGNAKRGAAGELSATRIVYGKAAALPRAKKIAALLGGGTLVKEPKPDVTGMMSARAEDAADIKIVLGRDLAARFGARSAGL